MEASACARAQKAIEGNWRQTCVYMINFLFVELKVIGSFVITEASAREFFEIEGSWGFGIDGSKCMCACVCVSLCNSCL